MNKAKFISSGGWVKRLETSRPITRWMVFLATISFIPALGAFLLLSWDAPNFWHDLFSFSSLGILLPFPTLVVAAIVTYFVEPPRTIPTVVPNPDYDPHNLY